MSQTVRGVYKFKDCRPVCKKGKCKNKSDVNDIYYQHLCASCFKEIYL